MRRVFSLAIISAVILGITPPAFAADTSSPVLVDWKLLDTKTDISTGDGKLRIEFSVSDESGISDPLSSLSSQSTTQQSNFAFPTLISKVGNISTYRSEATISFGKAPGLWRWLLFPLRDSLGNSSNGFGPGGSWPVEVWVYDKDFTEAKKLAADAKAIADKAAVDAKATADAKAAADAKAIADKAAADAKAIADKAAADAKAIADKAAADAKAIADKAVADAKAIADKAAADARRKEQTISAIPLVSGSVPLTASGFMIKVSSTSNLSLLTFNNTNSICEFGNGFIKTIMPGRCVIVFSQEGNVDFKPASNLILDFNVVSTAATAKTTITCTKGKLIKKVTAVKPKCPAGYKVKK